jgi:adenylate cyclase
MRMSEAEVIGRPAEECFAGANAWLLERVRRVQETWAPDMTMDVELVFGGDILTVNLSVLPLRSVENTQLGSMIMIEDISTEKRVKSTMARYMDPSIADQLLQQGAEVLGGSAKLATILFADIRGFTSLTEELGPSATVTFLNEYFTIMVDCIQDQGGMLDKFVGDAIMAIFGLPMAHDDDEDRSVRAAIAMLTALAAWNRDRVAEGKKAVDIGVGLNSDVIVSGNIGSPKRMDYTVIGDGVNLASRLESACKQYGTKILVSEYTFQRLRGTYRTREIDRVIVKGKSEPVGIYEILDYHTEATFPNLVDALAHFRDGLARYRSQNWDGARREFEAGLAINPADRVSSLYLDRCDWFAANPPDEAWDGVWVMESK